jgi:hypothetical protein
LSNNQGGLQQYHENQHVACVFKLECESNTDRSGSVAKNPPLTKVENKKTGNSLVNPAQRLFKNSPSAPYGYVDHSFDKLGRENQSPASQIQGSPAGASADAKHPMQRRRTKCLKPKNMRGYKRQNGRHKIPDGLSYMKKQQILLAQVAMKIPQKTGETKTKATIIYHLKVDMLSTCMVVCIAVKIRLFMSMA